MSYIDAIIIATIVTSTAIGYKKGLIKTLLSLTSYMAAIVLSKLYYIKLSQWLKNNTNIFSGIEVFVYNNFEAMVSSWISTEYEAATTPIKIWDTIMINLLENTNIEAYALQATEAVKNQVITAITTFFLNIIAMLLIFIVVRVSIIFIGRLLDLAFDLPPLRPINKIGGIMVGLIRGLIIAFLFLFIIVPLVMRNPTGTIAYGIEESLIINKFYNNWFDFLLKWILSL
ncbi:CvpA family protein [Alkaliphilus pronyensis]|uniref:CvpA family protein n=1 Tax=Alkaliphilus pronyensis TaxID=1482732 RepID=A0A6I0EYH0_9FIRM|nr:CvpA family protein [Alkaliphilus pronyensis]KAB3530295.1 CvpA family protein [Alkaliphilus pronyensis]